MLTSSLNRWFASPRPFRFLRKVFYLLVCLAVVFGAFALRTRAVALLPIDYDEDDYLLAGQHYAAAILKGDLAEILNYDYNLEHPPLVKLIYGLVLTRLPQVPEILERPTSAPPASTLPQPQLNALRETSAVLGTLEALALAVMDPLAGFFLAVHTFTIKYTSQAMLEALPALASLLAVLAYSRWKEKRRSGWLALSGVMLGLAAAGKYLYAVAGIAILVHWIWIRAREAPLAGFEAVKASAADFLSEKSTGISAFGRLGKRRPASRWSDLNRWKPLLAWGLITLAVFFLADPFLWPNPLGRLKASILFNANYAQGEQVSNAALPFWQPISWLFQSVPWHPGVFLVMIDVLIAFLALAGIKRLWQRGSVFVVWLGVGIGFLLLWPTKWPQYVLVVSAPLSLAAAEGFRGVFIAPVSAWLKRPKAGAGTSTGLGPNARLAWRETRRAMPWLLPGLITLGVIALFPLIYQAAMALTDFRAMAIKDGLNGGVWREVWLGVTRQVKPVTVEPFSQSFTRVRQVHYGGISLLVNLLFGLSGDLLVFEGMWTVLSVGLQLALGIGAAMLLNRHGVLFKRWWRAILILPWAIPEFVGALVWARMFEPRFGWFFLATSFPETPGFSLATHLASWQQQPNLALVVLLTAATWYGFPLMMLATTAALKMIPGEVYDAAALDGAGWWSKFRWVTWPMILPLLAPAIIIRAIFAFNQFYLFYVLQTPYPLITLSTLSFFVFDTNSSYGGQFAVSAAINLITVIFLVIFLVWFNRWSKAGEGVSYA